MKIKLLFRYALYIAVCLYSVSAFSEEFAPPPYNVIDQNYVNVASGYVSPSLTDLSIGGDLGLTHTISSTSSQFVNLDSDKGTLGFVDNYQGGLYTAYHSSSRESRCINVVHDISCEFRVLRAFGGGYSQDFEINSTNGTYTPLSDARYSLEVQQGRGYVLTAPDGTEILYGPTSITTPYTDPFGYARFAMREIIKPNGFIISISRLDGGTDTRNDLTLPLASVTTNTGFQLKYVRDLSVNNDTLPPEKQNTNVIFEPLIPVNADYWATYNPHKIIGINRRYVYCNPDLTQSCSQSDWPTATYVWPNGMPKAMYIGESIFKVIDASGGETEYHHTAFDTDISPFNGEPISTNTNGIYTTPRISAIKPANATEPVVYFDYENNTAVGGSDWSGTWFNVTGEGVLKEATRGNERWTYSVGDRAVGGPGPNSLFYHYNQSFGHNAISKAYTNSDYKKGVMYYVETRDSIHRLGENLENRLWQIDHKQGGGTTTFKYDDHSSYVSDYSSPRGNLVETNNNGSKTIATYESACDASNKKYCNKVATLQDPEGNITSYTYHPESGQLATVTSPANEQGLIAQTRYHYKKYFARYKKNSNSLTTETRGIWLLDYESHCANSNYVNDSCVDSDEVITRYEYEPYNLFKVGIKVTAKNELGNTVTRVSCIKYDKFGNIIGELSPRAGNLTCL